MIKRSTPRHLNEKSLCMHSTVRLSFKKDITSVNLPPACMCSALMGTRMEEQSPGSTRTARRPPATTAVPSLPRQGSALLPSALIHKPRHSYLNHLRKGMRKNACRRGPKSLENTTRSTALLCSFPFPPSPPLTLALHGVTEGTALQGLLQRLLLLWCSTETALTGWCAHLMLLLVSKVII